MTGIQNALAAAKRAAAALYEVAGLYAREIKERLDALFKKAAHFTRFAMLFLVVIFIVAWIWHPLAMVVVPLLIVGGFAVAFTALTNWRALEVFAGIAGVEELLANHSAIVKELEDGLHKLLVEIRKMIAWLCAVGMYLTFVPISNHRIYAIWLLVVIVGIIFSGEIKLLRRVFVGAFVVLTIVFFGLPDINANADTTPKFAAGFQSQHWGCGAKQPDLDLFTAPDKLITPYYPVEGCFAKLVLPGHSHHWHLQTAGAKQPGDWLSIACTDGRVVVPPQDPDSGARFECNYNDGREENTFLFQGHIASGITFVTQ